MSSICNKIVATEVHCVLSYTLDFSLLKRTQEGVAGAGRAMMTNALTMAPLSRWNDSRVHRAVSAFRNAAMLVESSYLTSPYTRIKWPLKKSMEESAPPWARQRLFYYSPRSNNVGESETRERVLSGCSAPPILCFFLPFFHKISYTSERTMKFFRFAAKNKQ